MNTEIQGHAATVLAELMEEPDSVAISAAAIAGLHKVDIKLPHPSNETTQKRVAH
ncbi:MAG TPA: hypothetical protein VIF10_05765 [Methylobacter sp.]|jgi:hypothetical protein